jgi:hypothetical protein
MRRWLYWPFYTVCYLLWLAFGWCVWMVVRLLVAAVRLLKEE